MRLKNILIAGGVLAIIRTIMRQTFTERALAREKATRIYPLWSVTNQSYVQQMVTEVTLYFGRIDIVVNNAAVALISPVSSLTIADFEAAMATMYWGTVYTSLAVLLQMKARKSGRIVNITSIGGKVSVPHMLTYSSAKFAATGFSEGLRAELLKDGIIVTTVAPGLIRTGSYLRALFKGKQEGEFAWFALGDTLPFISMDAQKAAVQIVEATRRGQSELITTLPTIVAAKVNGLFPGQVSNLSALFNHSSCRQMYHSLMSELGYESTRRSTRRSLTPSPRQDSRRQTA